MRFIDSLRQRPALRVAGILGWQCYTVYFVLGFNWRWDGFDQVVLAVVAPLLALCLWREGNAVYQHFIIRPREEAWTREINARRARRAAAQNYLRQHHHER